MGQLHSDIDSRFVVTLRVRQPVRSDRWRSSAPANASSRRPPPGVSLGPASLKLISADIMVGVVCEGRGQLAIGRIGMNEDTLKGKWTQLKGKVREQWGKLTDDDIDQIRGES